MNFKWKWRASNEHSSLTLFYKPVKCWVLFKCSNNSNKMILHVYYGHLRPSGLIWGPPLSFDDKARASNESRGPQMKSLGPQMTIIYKQNHFIVILIWFVSLKMTYFKPNSDLMKYWFSCSASWNARWHLGLWLFHFILKILNCLLELVYFLFRFSFDVRKFL